MVERERMESMTRASLNGYAVTARIESGHGRSPLPYRRLHGLVRFAKLLRPCPVKLLNIYSTSNSIRAVQRSSMVEP